MTSPKPSQQPDTRLPSLRAADAILAKFDVSSPHRDPAYIRRKLSAIIAEETNYNASPDNALLSACEGALACFWCHTHEMRSEIVFDCSCDNCKAFKQLQSALALAGGGNGV